MQPDVDIGLGPGDLPAGAGLVQAELVGEGERSVPSIPPLHHHTHLHSVHQYIAVYIGEISFSIHAGNVDEVFSFHYGGWRLP